MNLAPIANAQTYCSRTQSLYVDEDLDQTSSSPADYVSIRNYGHLMAGFCAFAMSVKISCANVLSLVSQSSDWSVIFHTFFVSDYRCVSDCRSRGRKFDTFVEIYHEIISTVMLLPSAESFKKGCCQLQAKVCAQRTG